jgi:hypothetical protein
VIECHLSYRDVLELTPLQAIALVTEDSDPPGLLQPDTLLSITRSLERIYHHGG